MSEITAIPKQLKIKGRVVQRLAKEYVLYVEEVKQLYAKKEKLIKEGAEEWNIKNATNMREESEKMVEDTSKRLKTATEGLTTLITLAKGKNELVDDEELIKAERILEDAVELKV